MGPFDPLGPISPFIIQLKLVMRSLAIAGISKDGWDASVGQETAFQFEKACQNLSAAGKFTFLFFYFAYF